MVSRSPATEEELLERFSAALARNRLLSTTVKSYMTDVREMLRWLNRANPAEIPSGTISDRSLVAYRSYLLASFRPATVNRKLASAGAFFGWADQTGTMKANTHHLAYVKVNPAPKPSLSSEAQGTLLRYAAERGTLREKAIIALFLRTGIRLSELCSLSWKDVHIADSGATISLHTRNSRLKPAGVRREIPIDREVSEALLQLGYEENVGSPQSIFGKDGRRTSRRTIQRLLSRFTAAIGVHANPRMLQKTFLHEVMASHVNPALLARIAGHRNFERTLLEYVHPAEQSSRPLHSDSTLPISKESPGPQISERWLSVGEVAQHLGVAPNTIYIWIRQRKLPAYRVGGRWRFRSEEVDNWVRNGSV